MQFFLHEIVARVVAIYLFADCGSILRHGLAERKIVYFNTDLLDWLLSDSSKQFVHRDTAPVRYWALMSSQFTGLVACFIVAIFGWFQPNT
jgi:hypothetical protein